MKNKYIIENDIVKIFLHRRYGFSDLETIIDLEDFDKINAFKGTWHGGYYPKLAGKYYAFITIYKGLINGKPKYNNLRLHRVILDLKYISSARLDVDHINGNSLDNRKSNLKITTRDINVKNRKRANKNNKTGCRNVSFWNNLFLVQLQIKGKNKLFGKFKNLEDANLCAIEMRKKYYGE